MLDMIYRQLGDEIEDLRRGQREQSSRSERAEYSGAVEAFTLAAAPTGDGLGDNVAYTTLAWISDGRKPGEGGGSGTGVLAWWDAGSSGWISVFDQSTVLT